MVFCISNVSNIAMCKNYLPFKTCHIKIFKFVVCKIVCRLQAECYKFLYQKAFLIEKKLGLPFKKS